MGYMLMSQLCWLQVTIVDRDEREEQNLITRRNTALRDHQIHHGLNGKMLQQLDLTYLCNDSIMACILEKSRQND